MYLRVGFEPMPATTKDVHKNGILNPCLQQREMYLQMGFDPMPATTRDIPANGI